MKITVSQSEVTEAVSLFLKSKGYEIASKDLKLVPEMEREEFFGITFTAELPDKTLRRVCNKCGERSNNTTCPKCVKPTAPLE
jgi:hypothetical protein